MKKIAAILLLLILPVVAVARVPASQRETPVVLAVRKSVPAVVNISTETLSESQSFSTGDPFFDRFFSDFFGGWPQTSQKSTSLGSGVIIDDKGHVLTNEHVIRKASKIMITTSDGTVHEAKLVGADSSTDLAVLKVAGKKRLPYIEMGSSQDLMIGETVIAIGNPFGLSHTVTTGVVSAVDRTIRGGDGQTYSDFIQTDASINPGNSGGPLLNIAGELIGINTAIYQSAEGIGFAIPISKARRIVDDLISYGEVHRSWIGVQVQEVDQKLADHYDLGKPTGVLVKRVFGRSPASKAGIARGDIILKLDGKTINTRADYLDRLAGYTAGTSIDFTVLTKGGEKNITVRAEDVPESYSEWLSEEWLGVEVIKNSEAEAKKRRLATTKGVVIATVARGSAAAEAGFKPGDVIRQVNDTDVDAKSTFFKAILDASHRETVVILVQRGRTGYHVSLNP